MGKDISKEIKILAIDDDKLTLLILEKNLVKAGFIVETVNSAVDAIKLLTEKTFDIVISDIKMPNLSGFDLMIWIKANKISSKLIMISSDVNSTLKKDYEKYGALQIIEKPFTYSSLLETIDFALKENFNADINNLNMFDLVKILIMSCKNKAIEIKSDISNKTGVLYIKDSEVFFAKYDESIEGEDAFYKLMSIQNGVLSEIEYNEKIERNINLPSDFLLMEAARFIDSLESKNCSENARVLVVDDDPVVLKIIKEFLTKKHCIVTTEESSSNALKLIAHNKYNFLISDINMPEFNGIQLLDIIKGTGINLGVILITGFGNDEYASKSINKGALKYLEKPVNLNELYKIVVKGIHGNISEVTLLDYVQLMLNSRTSVLISVYSPIVDLYGKIYIKEGKVIHAEYYNMIGEEAFYAMALIRRGIFSELKWEEPSLISIEKSPMKLLMKISNILEISDNEKENDLKSYWNKINTKVENELLKLALKDKSDISDLKKDNINIDHKKLDKTLKISSSNTIKNNKFSDVIEITDGIYWVSHRNPDSLLQLNTFLRVFKGSNGKDFNLLIDPGASEYFPVISSKVSKVIGDISKIQMYSINHQDPDVGMNATFISRINPRSVCLCTEDSWRLVKLWGIPQKSFKDVYNFSNKITTLSTDSSHSIEFVPTPYCHFVGAFALYDRKNRTLFTGDLFGGLNPIGNLSLVATEEHWEGMKTFHQIYMPSSKAIKNAIDNIRKLDPQPLMIVPQHGAILVGEIMNQFMNRLYNLEVGADLFNKELIDKKIPIYIDLMNSIYERILSFIGIENIRNLFKFDNKKEELFHLVDMDEKGIKNIFSNPERALNLMLEHIFKCGNTMIVNDIKAFAIKESLVLRISLPINLYSMSDLEEKYVVSNLDKENKNTIFV